MTIKTHLQDQSMVDGSFYSRLVKTTHYYHFLDTYSHVKLLITAIYIAHFTSECSVGLANHTQYTLC